MKLKAVFFDVLTAISESSSLRGCSWSFWEFQVVFVSFVVGQCYTELPRCIILCTTRLKNRILLYTQTRCTIATLIFYYFGVIRKLLCLCPCISRDHDWQCHVRLHRNTWTWSRVWEIHFHFWNLNTPSCFFILSAFLWNAITSISWMAMFNLADAEKAFTCTWGKQWSCLTPKLGTSDRGLWQKKKSLPFASEGLNFPLNYISMMPSTSVQLKELIQESGLVYNNVLDRCVVRSLQ